MTPFVIAIADRLDAEPSLMAKVSVGSLTSNSKSIAIRLTPTPPGERYLDSRTLQTVGLQVLAKSDNELEVLQQMDIIDGMLNMTNGDLVVPGHRFIKCETYTTPNYIERDEQGRTIYTALYQAELIKGGNS